MTVLPDVEDKPVAGLQEYTYDTELCAVSVALLPMQILVLLPLGPKDIFPDAAMVELTDCRVVFATRF